MPALKANLYPRGTVLNGLRGSGKSNAARYIARLDPQAVLVYDPQNEFPEYDAITPKKSTFPETVEEFARICQKMKLDDTTKHNYRLLIVDEAHLIAPNSAVLHPYVAQMNARHRHWPLGVVWITQRPRQLHYNVFNLVDYLFLWLSLSRENVRVYCSAIMSVSPCCGQDAQAIILLGPSPWTAARRTSMRRIRVA